MQHYRSLEEVTVNQQTVVSIGAFDGVHRGHQSLIEQVITYSSEHNQIPAVLTFYPHPEMVLRGFRPGFYLTMPDAKASLLGQLGVQLVISHPFDDHVRHMRAAEFVDRLIKYLHVGSLWIGPDFAMGYQREGTVEFLRGESIRRKFDLRVVDLMDAGGERVSSTRIRNALAMGGVGEAARLLGRLYSLPGLVVRGAGRGRTIGIPTANLAVQEEQAIPAQGVYAAWAYTYGQRNEAVVNIGHRPTFDGAGSKQTVEAHLLNYSGDLYDETIHLDFLTRLRDEKKFDGVDALVAQIQVDIESGRKAFAAYSPS
jgi:riboflavin kinase/FMN adenylyltransferase